jgi:hypothetical protein
MIDKRWVITLGPNHGMFLNNLIHPYGEDGLTWRKERELLQFRLESGEEVWLALTGLQQLSIDDCLWSFQAFGTDRDGTTFQVEGEYNSSLRRGHVQPVSPPQRGFTF